MNHFRTLLGIMFVLFTLSLLTSCSSVSGKGGDSVHGNAGDGIRGNTTVETKPETTIDADVKVTPLD